MTPFGGEMGSDGSASGKHGSAKEDKLIILILGAA
jgi:hypothetical protein